MAEPADTRIWMNRGLFILLAFVIVVGNLVPFDMQPSSWAAPDLLLAVTLAWVVRKPDYIPVFVIAILFLMTDLLFQRPPGLWAALVVVLTETIRRQNRDFRNMPVLIEWSTVAIAIIAMTLINRLILAIVMVPQAPLGLTLIQMITTILSYPFVVLVAHFVFGITRSAPGQVGSRGQKI